MNNIYISKVIIKNWGPFYGKNTISFSTNANKNVSYILGKNSTGKTKAFEAITFALFSDKLEEFDLWEKANSEAKKEAETTGSLYKTKVEIMFSIVDQITSTETNYHIKRSYQYDTKLYKPTFFGSFVDTSGNTVPIKQKEFDELIDKYIPIGPREFYFLDGETLVQLFKTHIEVVKDLTEKQSIIPRLEKMVAGLLDRKKEISKNVKSLGSKNKTLNKWTTAYYNQVRALAESQANKKKLEEEKGKYIKKMAGIQKQLMGSDPSVKKKLDNLDTLIEEKASKLSEKNTNIRTLLLQSATHILLEDVYDWCLADLEEKKRKKIIPSAITGKVVDEILSSYECVCETKITPAIEKVLKDFKKNIPKGELNEEVIRFRQWLTDVKDKITEDKAALKLFVAEKKVVKNQYDKHKEDLKLLKKGVADKILNLIEKLESVNEKISEKSLEINDVDQEIKDFKKEEKKSLTMIKKTRTQLKGKISTSLQADLKKLEHENNIIKKLEIYLENIIEDSGNFIRNYVEDKTSKKYIKFIWNPSEWSGITINDEWQFYAIQKKTNIPIISKELSKGQRHVLAISYMSSLPLITPIQLPFLFDSPFGGISKEPISNIGKFLPEILKGSQIILFVTDTEHNSVYPHIKNKIGAKYTIHYKDNRASFQDIINLDI